MLARIVSTFKRFFKLRETCDRLESGTHYRDKYLRETMEALHEARGPIELQHSLAISRESDFDLKTVSTRTLQR